MFFNAVGGKSQQQQQPSCSTTMVIHGFLYAQVFYGVTSRCFNIYGMRKKSQVPKVYREFLKDGDISSRLHCNCYDLLFSMSLIFWKAVKLIFFP